MRARAAVWSLSDGFERHYEHGYDVGDNAAASCKSKTNEKKPYDGRINVKILGDAVADSADHFVVVSSVKFFVHSFIILRI